MSPRSCRGLVLLFSLVLVPHSAAAREKWVCVESRNFRVFTDSRERDAVDLLVNLEQFRQSVGQVVGRNDPLSVPIDVFLFRDQRGFKPYLPVIAGHRAEVAGFFHSGSPKSLIALQRGWGKDQATRTVFHEYTHYLTREYRWPLWLTEGVAEYFSTFALVKKGVRLGIPIVEHVNLLRERPLIPLEDLVHMTQEDVGYRDERRTSTFYAQSWALFHLLRLGPHGELTAALDRYITDLREREAGQDTFLQVFAGLPVQKNLSHYINQKLWTVQNFDVDTSAVEREVTKRPVETTEIQVRLAELLLSGKNLEEARQTLAALGTGAAKPSGWYEVAGLLALIEGRWAEGVDLFGKALEQEPGSFLNHYYYAVALQNASGSNPEEWEIRLAEVVGHLQQSVSGRPEFFEGFEWLAKTSLYSARHLDQGVAAAVRALRLRPSKHELALTLARLLVAKGDLENARSVLEKLETVGITNAIREQVGEIRAAMDRGEGFDGGMNPLPAEGWARIPFEFDQPLHPEDPDERTGRPDLRRNTPPASELGPGTDAPDMYGPIRCLPAFAAIDGHLWAEGLLLEIQCEGDEITYVLEVSDQRLEMRASSDAIVIFSCEPIEREFRCGPLNAPAVAYFVEEAGFRRALAIEIKPGTEGQENP